MKIHKLGIIFAGMYLFLVGLYVILDNFYLGSRDFTYALSKIITFPFVYLFRIMEDKCEFYGCVDYEKIFIEIIFRNTLLYYIIGLSIILIIMFTKRVLLKSKK